MRHACSGKHTSDIATVQNRLALAPCDLSQLTVRYIDHAFEPGVINKHHDGLHLFLFKLSFLHNDDLLQYFVCASVCSFLTYNQQRFGQKDND
jgi:hypothetical protein